MNKFETEISDGERFQFGKNWTSFLNVINEERITQAELTLCSMLRLHDLHGKKFIDIGCGSGLASLAARRLGAIVHSFDYDPNSVECTNKLKRKYYKDDKFWIIEHASVLDEDYIDRLGKFDIVYSWGVLHHTGNMNNALENVALLVRQGGLLYLAIYNDQGGQSRRWRTIKQIYNKLPLFLKFPYTIAIMGPRELMFFIFALIKGKPKLYFNNIKQYSKNSLRGMSYWHDIVDWIGGYPFEVAKPEEIFNFYKDKGFILENLKTCGGGLACNEYIFINNP